MKSKQLPEALTSLLALAPSKAQIRKLQIIEGAIRCYARLGPDRTTFDMIGKEAKTSRPLLLHYFATKEEIITLAAQYVRKGFQEHAVQALQRGRTVVEMLDLYVESCFDWQRDEPDHSVFWLHFFALCRPKSKFRKLHNEMVELGQKRIAALIEKGQQDKMLGKSDAMETASLVQTLITGALVQLMTEDFTPQRRNALKASVVEQVRIAARYKC